MSSVQDMAEIGPHAWRALVSATPTAGFFSTWEWVSSAARAVRGPAVAQVIALRAAEELVACLPLVWQRERLHGLPARTLRFLGHPLSDRVTVLATGGDARLQRAVLDASLRCARPWDAAVLSELPEDPRLRAVIDEWARGRGLVTHWRHCARSPILRLDVPDVPALRGAYPKSLATRLRRSRKRLEAAGVVRFERRTPAPEEVSALLRRFKAIEDVSWKGQAGVGIFSTPDRQRFFEDVGCAVAVQGWLDVGMLYLDERMISYRLGFRHRGVFFDYNLAFDPTYAGVSPGRILLDEMIASSLELGLSAVDGSRGGLDRPHQLGEWTQRFLDHHEVWILRRTPVGRALALLRNVVRPGLHRWRAWRERGRREVPGTQEPDARTVEAFS